MNNNQKSKSIFLLCLIGLYVLLVSFLIMPNYKNFYIPFSLSYFLACFIIGIGFFKINRKKDRTKYDTIQIVLLATLFYIVITYLSGLFLGFNRNPLSLKIPNMIKNLTIYGIIIISEEFIRYNIVKSFLKSKIILILILILFTWLNLIVPISTTNFGSSIEIFKFISKELLPAISTNILLIYMTYKTNYIPNVLYRFMMELPIYILPIFPNFGIYIESIVKLTFTTMIIYKLSYIYLEADREERRAKKPIGLSRLIIALTLAFTLSVALLISGIFKYQLISIASNSMNPIFERGDAVIFEKISSVGMENIKKGNIVVYDKDGVSIVHRIIKIERKNNSYIFTFKGDNNEIADKDDVYESQIIGVVKTSIPKIGYPSVWFSEQLNK